MVLIYVVLGKGSSFRLIWWPCCLGQVSSSSARELSYFLLVSLQPGSKMVSSAKAAVPTVSDQAAAMQLSQCAKNLATSLAELRTASQKASGLLVTAVSSSGMELLIHSARVT